MTDPQGQADDAVARYSDPGLVHNYTEGPGPAGSLDWPPGQPAPAGPPRPVPVGVNPRRGRRFAWVIASVFVIVVVVAIYLAVH